MTKVNYKTVTLTLGLIVFSFLFVWYVFAQWTEPTAIPPGDNVPAPLNVGPDGQIKEGGLIIANNSAVTNGLSVRYGNVGIGTTGPGFKLDVTDRMRVRSGAGGTAGIWLSNSAGTNRAFVGLNEDDATPLVGFYNSGWRLVVNNAGNVGIGTTGPAHKLDVEGNAEFGTGTSNLELVQDGQVFQIRHHDPGVAWRDISFPYGNVGIGLTNPGYKLTIDGNLDLRNWGQGYSIGSGQAGMYMPLNTLDLRFKTNNADRMTILSNGNVGIGITNPGVKLDVQGRISVRNSGGDTHILSQAGGVSTFFGVNHARVIANGGTLYLESASGVNITGEIQNELRLGAARTHMVGFDGVGNHWITAGGVGNEAIGLRSGTRDVYIGWDLHVAGRVYSANGYADVTEYINVRKGSNLEPGDAVMPDYESDEGRVRKTSQSYDTRVIGVISSEETAAMILGDDGNGDKKLIALGGQVPTKATAEGGSIKPGDMLVTSSKPGFVMKADPDKVKPGMVVGKALTGLEEGEGKIIVFVGAN